jgi:hypothetical protein
MEDITKDLFDSILYDENGNKSDIHEEILDGLKSLKTNIQLGGGISISTELDINDLFDDSGKLKKQYGGIKFIKRTKVYIKYVKFNNFYKNYTKIMNVIEPLSKDIIKFYELIKTKMTDILSLLKNYYMSKKIIITLKYILDKRLMPDELRNKDLVKREISYLNNKNVIIVKKLNRAYTLFKKEFSKSKFSILKLSEYNVDSYNILNDKLIKVRKEIAKSEKYYSDNFAILEQDIDEISDESKNLFKKLRVKLDNFDKYSIKVFNKLKDLSDKMGYIETINVEITKRFNNYNKFDDSVGKVIKKEVYNVYDNIDELSTITKKMADNFEPLANVMTKLQSKLDSFFSREIHNNVFSKKMKDFSSKLNMCYKISSYLFKSFIEIKTSYAGKDFPPPNVTTDFNTIYHAYDGIKVFFEEFNKVFSVFIQESTNKIIIDNISVVKFIKEIQGLTVGGDIITSLDNTYYYLHSYDMYAIKDSNNTLKTQLRYYNHETPGGIYDIIVYNGNTTLFENKQNKLQPGIVMVSLEYEYNYNNIIISKFVNDLKKILNKPKPTFAAYLYKGIIYVYIINILKSNNINVILHKKIDIKNIKPKFKLNVLGFDYYGYIPKDIIELHKKKLSDISNKKEKNEIDKKQKVVIIIPFFIYLSKLDQLEKTKYKNIPNAIYNYEIYLPIDTLFNKILIPYVPVNIKDYMMSKKKTNDFITKIYNDTFNNNIININLMSIKPDELELLKSLKYVLFFTDEMKIYDNSVGNSKRLLDISDDIKKNITNIYTDYFNFFQGYNNKLKVMTNVENIKFEKINTMSTNINFMSNNINKEKLIKYYNSENYKNYISYFKYIYYTIINDIDINIIKLDNISEIEDLEITVGPGNTLEKSVFTTLLEMKELFEENLSVYAKLYDEIYIKNVIKEKIASIDNSYQKLNAINNDELNKEIKLYPSLVPKIPGAAEFYKNQEENPEYPQLKSINELQKVMSVYSEKELFSEGTDTIGDFMLTIANGLNELGDTRKEAELKRLTGKGYPSSLRKGEKYPQSLINMIPNLITKNGADKLIHDIMLFNQDEGKGETYKGYGKSFLRKLFNAKTKDNEYIGIGESLYKLNEVIIDILSADTTDKLKTYKNEKTGGYAIYKSHFKTYEEDLDKQINMEQEKKEQRSRYKKEYDNSTK